MGLVVLAGNRDAAAQCRAGSVVIKAEPGEAADLRLSRRLGLPQEEQWVPTEDR